MAEILIKDVAPNPMSLRVAAYENDHGDPNETAEKLQKGLVKISNEVASLAAASSADAASGPGLDTLAASGGIGGALAGPLGALLALGLVEVFGLGDDFVGQSARVLYQRSDDVGSPATLGTFQGTPFNLAIDINGGDEGDYRLFFDVRTRLRRPDEDL